MLSTFASLFLYYASFSNQRKRIVFRWSLSNSKSPHVFRTLQSILTDLYNVAVRMAPSSPFTKPLGIVLSAPITNGNTVSFTFHSFFSLLVRSIYLSFCFLWSLVCGQPEWQSPFFSRFFCFCWLSLGLVVWPGLGDLFVSQNPREFCASHSLGRILFSAYTIGSFN